MQFEYKFASSEQKFVNDHSHFKLIISNIIEIIVDYYLMEF